MITLRPANGELIDYTATLEFLCGDMIAPGCSVILDEWQFQVLLSFLERIAALGDGVNFKLEMCVDDRPGYSVSWDNDGTEEQDRAVDRMMEELVQSLGFNAASIRNPGQVADPADILNAIHREDAAQAILNKVPDTEPEAWDRMPEDEETQPSSPPNGT
ncbi:hypothetical protein G6K88_13860 [Agrobacterium rhizogenes]|uniref:hypothetical protein n=1 Tax=Rhizobium rhizogenes TaxID=359 RepID=UPI00115EEBA9|nr:hypothetical protein [Rhizobium rhizogenes]NTI03105.1 hypothetical protein [Rhizobium rhizogenes]NTI09909.1 hypothetical protein [Rhizobium rhizogenes]TRB20254.1 hypothetical protein EXN70_26345 [Rhizobium rhizogenes]